MYVCIYVCYVLFKMCKGCKYLHNHFCYSCLPIKGVADVVLL